MQIEKKKRDKCNECNISNDEMVRKLTHADEMTPGKDGECLHRKAILWNHSCRKWEGGLLSILQLAENGGIASSTQSHLAETI